MVENSIHVLIKYIGKFIKISSIYDIFKYIRFKKSRFIYFYRLKMIS